MTKGYTLDIGWTNYKIFTGNMGIKVYQNIVDIIGGMIESGDLSGGDRLPPERKLAETFQVSRNTIREAIKTLAEKKVLITLVGSGTFVAESALDVLQASISETLEQKRHRIRDIFELRKILEPQIAALAAKRIRKETIETLDDILAKQEEAFHQGQSTREMDERFHRTLAKASGNTVLFHVYERLQDIFSESRVDDLQSHERKKMSLAIHKDIFESIKDGNSDKAARKMSRHMRQIQKTLDKTINKAFIKRSVKRSS